ncbi:hypothetical protein IAT38_006520 [Cryptococcus sp. DSM 104549]
MPNITPRTEPHTSDGTEPKKDFFDKHPVYFYSIGGGILLLVLIICFYSLWRGPQRSYWPDMCTRRRRKEGTGGGGSGPVPMGSEGMWGAEQGPGVGGGGGKWRKTVYLTDLKKATNTLGKPRPGDARDGPVGGGVGAGGIGAPGGASTTSLGTSGTERGGGGGRRKQGSWTGTISSFGHSASMLMSFGPGSLTISGQGQGQAQAPGYPPMQRASSESYRGPAAPGGSAPSLEALREDSPEMFYTQRGRMEGQAWQSTPRLPPPGQGSTLSGASSYPSVGGSPTSWATPRHSPYTPPPGQSPHTPGWGPSPLGGGPPPPSVGMATTPLPQGWVQPAPGPAGGIQAPTPVYARPRSAAPPSVPSPLGTPPAGPPMPGTPRAALPPIIATGLGAAPPRLSPRVQFSPLPMPTANSSSHSLLAPAAQASTSTPVAGTTPSGSPRGGGFGYAI